MSYTINGWREDSFAVVGVDDETGDLVTIAVTEAEHASLVAYLRAAAKSSWPHPRLEAQNEKVITRRRPTLGDYGYNDD